MISFFVLTFISSVKSFRYNLEPHPKQFLSRTSIPSNLSEPFLIRVNLSNIEFNMTLDFSTSLVMIFSKACNCSESSSYFEDIKSENFGRPGRNPLLTIKLQNVTLEGHKYQLHMKYSENSLNSTEVPMQVFVINRAFNFSGTFMTDGFVGLKFPNGDEKLKTFSESLAEITELPTFAVIIRSEYENKNLSFIEFGAVSSSEGFLGKKRHKRVQDNVELWALVVTELQVRNQEVEGKHFGRFDVNSDSVKVPKELFNATKAMIKNHFEGLDDELAADCNILSLSSNLTFDFKIQRTKFPLRLKNLLVQEGDSCRFLFEENTEEEWVLGKPFFKDYFTVFDNDIKEITFYQIKPFEPGYYEVGIIIFTLLCPFVAAFAGWKATSKRKEDQLENEENQENLKKDKDNLDQTANSNPFQAPLIHDYSIN